MKGVEKYLLQKEVCVDPNKELVKAAMQARASGYHSYGEMQAAEYVKRTSDIDDIDAGKRRKAGYRTVREWKNIKDESHSNKKGGKGKC